MEVKEVEFLVVTFLPHPFQHHHVQRVRIAHGTVEPECPRPQSIQLRGCPRIAAGEQRYIVSQGNQLFRQPMHHPLGAAIKLGWNSLRQRSYLRDAHLTISSVRP
ncbi:hypothetical protein ACVWXO_010501 [Bradyrhizobium sp. LM2.7]